MNVTQARARSVAVRTTTSSVNAFVSGKVLRKIRQNFVIASSGGQCRPTGRIQGPAAALKLVRLSPAILVCLCVSVWFRCEAVVDLCKFDENVNVGHAGQQQCSVQFLHKDVSWWVGRVMGLKVCRGGLVMGLKVCRGGPVMGLKVCRGGWVMGLKVCHGERLMGLKLCHGGRVMGLKVCRGGWVMGLKVCVVVDW